MFCHAPRPAVGILYVARRWHPQIARRIFRICGERAKEFFVAAAPVKPKERESFHLLEINRKPRIVNGKLQLFHE